MYFAGKLVYLIVRASNQLAVSLGNNNNKLNSEDIKIASMYTVCVHLEFNVFSGENQTGDMPTPGALSISDMVLLNLPQNAGW